MDSPSHAALDSTDPRVQAALRGYFSRINRGEKIDVESFVAQHAEVAVELRSFIAFDQAARQLARGDSPIIGSPPADARIIKTPRPKAEASTHSVVVPIERTVAGRPMTAAPPLPTPTSAKSRSVAQSPNDLPEIFGRYQVKKKLGEGAMGAVYLAEDSLLQRKVAIKTPTFEDDAEGELLRRFHREARAVASLKHPNLCAVYDVGEIDGRHYISMEFVPGKKLQEFIKLDKLMTEKQAMAVVRKIAMGMHEAHAHGVIHRDLKPDNIMVNEKGEPVVMDFGLVHKSESKNSTKITQQGTLIGSPAYMSKEQVEGDHDQLTAATDQYSLGVILYQLLTSRLPFEGGIHAVLGAILTKTPPPPSQFRTDLNPHLEAVCLKMMAKDAQDRYPSMKAVADAIAEVVRGTSTASSGSVAHRLAVNLYGDGAFTPAQKLPATNDSALFGFDANDEPYVQLKTARRGRSLQPSRFVVYGILATGLSLLLATTLWFRNGDALVKVEVLNDDIEVTFQKNTITLGVGRKSITVEPGQHTLHVKSDGADFDTDKFTLKAGENPAITVELVKSEVVTKFGQKEIGRRALTAGSTGQSNANVELPMDTPPDAVAPQPAIAPFDADKAKAPQPAIAPFDADKAKAHQMAWAKHLGLPVEYTNSIGMKLTLIPPGEFTMGSSPEEIEEALKVTGDDKHWQECIKSEAPKHKVILTQPIYLGIHEVSQKDYEAVMGGNPSQFAPTGPRKGAVVGLDTSSHPVETVSWNDAAGFCSKLSERENLKPFQLDTPAGEAVAVKGTGYRLPTEAEWEFACRAGTTTRYWISNQDLPQGCWFNMTSGGRTHAGGELQSNPFGLYDIHGNVEEWVQDRWGPTYYSQFQDRPAIDPTGPISTGSLRVLRGGNWKDTAFNCRASFRFAYEPAMARGYHIGFRASLAVDAVKTAIAEHSTKPIRATTVTHHWPEDAPPPAIAPFDATQAKTHQNAWAAHQGVPVEYTNSLGMKFILIPPGEFRMGSAPVEIEMTLKVADENKKWQEGIKSEAPQHKVILTQPIYFGVHEVTQAQYTKVMGKNPSHFAATGAGKDSVKKMNTTNHPAEMVSWNDAVEFCAKLSQQENIQPFPVQMGETVTPRRGTGYRLPTEAEWEFACRAGTTTKYWSGDWDRDLSPAGWTRANAFGRTYAVGRLKANPFGLYDVHGNVWEWVHDVWDPLYYRQFQDQPAVDPRGPTGADSERVLRGGDWSNSPFASRSSYRHCGLASPRYNFLGFRLTLPVDVFTAASAESQAQPAGETAH